ncbi:M20/M25/M40 family metallo-hydrolase [Lentzea tibetensis]|uniref:M20/M25/M40 family metallo-hydrolase n=1 Tax=Lentzea tibetensis TaxID=2591470 RepID=A0A563EP33_9PSEU|nr:M20/M25/M40 family metallo-hydrolase [Lentzea tibetensis]TWP48858.1 M20/M25/M40 family metallo-hydrolase [Lentzea tibetensis]
MSTRAENLLRQMVDIPSPSGEEAAIAGFLAEVLPDFGFDEAYVDEVGNVIARRGDPAAPMIMLVGHMDTVPSQIPVRQEGTILHGRGTVDAKGPLATMICAAAEASAEGVQIVVAGVVEEETFGKGATHLAETFRPAVGFVGEPNGWAGVGIGYKGRVMMQIDVSRPSVHTASPEEKASEAGVAFWNKVVDYCTEVSTSDKAFERPIATLVEMKGDIEVASLTISVRTPPGFDLPAFEEFVVDAAGSDLLKIDDRTPAVRVDTAGSAVRALMAGIRARGERPRLKLKTGTADLNIVEPAWQVPMAVYGPGDSSLDHTDREHIDLVEYQQAIDVLKDALERLAEDLRAG